MLQTVRSYRGMVTAPHHLAARAGLRVLEDGGNAIEAMIAAAAAVAVVYPHMNGIGGDCFWLIHEPGKDPVAIDAAGPAAQLASADFYRDQGHDRIPERGPLAALTVAGAISGWSVAQRLSQERWGGRLPLDRLLEDAVAHARTGVAVTTSLHVNSRDTLDQLRDVPGHAKTFLDEAGNPRPVGARLRHAELAGVLEQLARAGLDDFYRGDLARTIAAELESAGSPLRLGDLEAYRALTVEPLSVKVRGHTVYNLPPPTQGLATLLILGTFDRLGVAEADGFDYVHGLVESTKRAFEIRDRHVTDPAYMTVDPRGFLEPGSLDERAAGVQMDRAAPWPSPAKKGDTVWLGAIDGEGRAVSFIQSLYWEFGSGLVLPETGIAWQNRGVSFSLDAGHLNELKPGRRPFHTIQPPLARLDDGRTMVFGTMGGDGQPQTQSVLFTRVGLYGQEPQQAVTGPRWLLGRTWGTVTTNLKIENRFEPSVIDRLVAAGHDVDVRGPFDPIVGHAGIIVHHPDGLREGANDPRSDGVAAGF